MKERKKETDSFILKLLITGWLLSRLLYPLSTAYAESGTRTTRRQLISSTDRCFPHTLWCLPYYNPTHVRKLDCG